MKRLVFLMLLLVVLCGCDDPDPQLERAMAFRNRLQGGSVTFTALITADYGDKSYTFTMDCQSERDGTLSFTVTQPDTLAGISGNISGVGGKLTFEDVVLAFDPMAQGRLSPISGPWVLMKALLSGYLTSTTMEEENLRIAVEDSYQDDALHLEIWLDEGDRPVTGEIYWDGRRLLTIQLTNFAFM